MKARSGVMTECEIYDLCIRHTLTTSVLKLLNVGGRFEALTKRIPFLRRPPPRGIHEFDVGGGGANFPEKTIVG